MRRIEIRKVHKNNVVHENPKLGSIYVVDFYEDAEYFGTKKFRNRSRKYIERVEEEWISGSILPSDIYKLKD
jgi:hypothetical protein